MFLHLIVVTAFALNYRKLLKLKHIVVRKHSVDITFFRSDEYYSLSLYLP